MRTIRGWLARAIGAVHGRRGDQLIADELASHLELHMADNVRRVAADADYALRPDALEDAVRRDVAAGRKPCAVVATTGWTTHEAPGGPAPSGPTTGRDP